jgi:hypothetical protein
METLNYGELAALVKLHLTFRDFLIDHGYQIDRKGKLVGQCPNCGSGSGVGKGRPDCAFHIYDGFGKCFSCDFRCDIFGFLEAVDKLDFKTAVRAIANEYGYISGFSDESVSRGLVNMHIGDTVEFHIDRGGNILAREIPRYKRFIDKETGDKYIKAIEDQRDEDNLIMRRTINAHLATQDGITKHFFKETDILKYNMELIT